MAHIDRVLAEEEKDFETNPVIQRLQSFDENAWYQWLSEEFRILAEEADPEEYGVRGNEEPSPRGCLVERALDKQMTGSGERAECCICRQPVEMGTLVTVLACGHWFHIDGIERWLNEHRTCPMCRRGVDEEGNPA